VTEYGELMTGGRWASEVAALLEAEVPQTDAKSGRLVPRPFFRDTQERYRIRNEASGRKPIASL
jgi:hypothetical protein